MALLEFVIQLNVIYYGTYNSKYSFHREYLLLSVFTKIVRQSTKLSRKVSLQSLSQAFCKYPSNCSEMHSKVWPILQLQIPHGPIEVVSQARNRFMFSFKMTAYSEHTTVTRASRLRRQ